MDVGFDPIAFLTSIFAVWFAYSESRKNNKVLVKIIDCKTLYSADLHDRSGITTQFKVLVRNQGLSLHDPAMSLRFYDKGGFGTFNIPLKRRDERTGEHSEFSKGMIAEFGLRADEFDRAAISFLTNLEDVAGQDVHLVLFSQGYLAKQIRVGGPRDRLALRWNRFAYKFNRRFDRQIGERGIKVASILPEVRELSTPVRSFVQQATRPPAPGPEPEEGKP